MTGRHRTMLRCAAAGVVLAGAVYVYKRRPGRPGRPGPPPPGNRPVQVDFHCGLPIYYDPQLLKTPPQPRSKAARQAARLKNGLLHTSTDNSNFLDQETIGIAATATTTVFAALLASYVLHFRPQKTRTTTSATAPRNPIPAGLALCSLPPVMSFFGMGRPQPTSAEKIAAVEQEMKLMASMHNRMILMCTKKCLPSDYREGDLNKGESVCLDRCAAKFFEAHTVVSTQLEKESQNRGGPAAGAGGGGFGFGG